jgi:hypothetical protein
MPKEVARLFANIWFWLGIMLFIIFIVKVVGVATIGRAFGGLIGIIVLLMIGFLVYTLLVESFKASKEYREKHLLATEKKSTHVEVLMPSEENLTVISKGYTSAPSVEGDWIVHWEKKDSRMPLMIAVGEDRFVDDSHGVWMLLTPEEEPPVLKVSDRANGILREGNGQRWKAVKLGGKPALGKELENRSLPAGDIKFRALCPEDVIELELTYSRP